jgi:hypothetical protein
MQNVREKQTAKKPSAESEAEEKRRTEGMNEFGLLFVLQIVFLFIIHTHAFL